MSKKVCVLLSLCIFSISFSMDNRKKALRVAIGISGTGSNMKKIIEKWQAGYFEQKLDIPVVFSSDENAGGVKTAKDLGIENVIVTPFGLKKNRDTDCERLDRVLHDHKIDFVILAGFMYLLNSSFVQKRKGTILNLHPSLLPKYPGHKAIEDAYNAFQAGQEIETGVSVIFVADDIDTKHGDTGQIIMQKGFTFEQNDTLDSVTQKIHAIEYDLFPAAIKKYCDEQWQEQ